jgi:hypothetical protein
MKTVFSFLSDHLYILFINFIWKDRVLKYLQTCD